DGEIYVAGGGTALTGDVSNFDGTIRLGRSDDTGTVNSAALFLTGDTSADITYQGENNGVLFLAGDDSYTVGSVLSGSAYNFSGGSGPGAGLHMIGSGIVT